MKGKGKLVRQQESANNDRSDIYLRCTNNTMGQHIYTSIDALGYFISDGHQVFGVWQHQTTHSGDPVIGDQAQTYVPATLAHNLDLLIQIHLQFFWLTVCSLAPHSSLYFSHLHQFASSTSQGTEGTVSLPTRACLEEWKLVLLGLETSTAWPNPFSLKSSGS